MGVQLNQITLIAFHLNILHDLIIVEGICRTADEAHNRYTLYKL